MPALAVGARKCGREHAAAARRRGVPLEWALQATTIGEGRRAVYGFRPRFQLMPAAPYVGTVAQVILDNYPYWVLANSYQMLRPRLRKATPRADLGESYVDFGPGKRQWKFLVLALNDLTNYDGTPTTFTGQEYRDCLWGSYARVNTLLTFIDPGNVTWQVRFEHLAEAIPDLRSQVNGLGYHMDVELVEG